MEEKKRGMVCRDFLRNVCKRGAACKFQHPHHQQQQQQHPLPPPPLYSFCHDFQNGKCRRSGFCKFIHSSHENELHYVNTGQLPPHLATTTIDQSGVGGGVPVCKQFLWSKCRHKNCKYKHVTDVESVVAEGGDNVDNGSGVIVTQPPLFNGHNYNDNMNDCPALARTISCWGDVGGAGVGVRGYENDNNKARGVFECVERGKCQWEWQRGHRQKRTYDMLEEENVMLRERVSELKKRVDDLQVTNEFLLEQNAQLRIGDVDKRRTATAMATVTVPAVTITGAAAAASPIQTPTPQQTMAIRTVTATVPVNVPVSLAAVSMAPVQIPPSVVTVAQPPPPPNPPPPTATVPPLVSYPIVPVSVIQPPPELHH